MPEIILVEVVVPPIAHEIAAGRLIVRVEEVAAADAPAIRVAVTTLEIAEWKPSPEVRLRFELPVPRGKELGNLEASAELRMHVDDGLAPGDLVTAAAAPVSNNRLALVRLQEAPQ